MDPSESYSVTTMLAGITIISFAGGTLFIDKSPTERCLSSFSFVSWTPVVLLADMASSSDRGLGCLLAKKWSVTCLLVSLVRWRQLSRQLSSGSTCGGSASSCVFLECLASSSCFLLCVTFLFASLHTAPPCGSAPPAPSDTPLALICSW